MTDSESEKADRSPAISWKVVAETGRIVGNWNIVEMLAQMIVVKILAVRFETGEAIFNSTSAPFQADVLIAVANDRFGEGSLAKRIQSAANSIKEMSNFRNDVVHGRWWSTGWSEDDDGVPHLVRKGRTSQITEAEFFTKSQKIKDLIEELRGLLNETSDACPFP